MRRAQLLKIILPLLLFSIFAIYVSLRIENSLKVREPRASFGDTHEYFQVAAEPFLSGSFWIAIRPPVLPLLYKFIGIDNDIISKFQLWFSILSWVYFSLAVVIACRSYFVKLISFVVILGFSLNQEIIMWDYLILSESMSISLMVIFLASSILLISNWTWINMVLFGIAALLFVLTRDAFAYYLLLTGISLLSLMLFSLQKKRLLIVCAYIFALFFLSNTLATSSGRWYHSLLNTISVRVLPNEEYLKYFKLRGMPVNEALFSRSGLELHTDSGVPMDDPSLKEFRDWVTKYGKQEYIRFLWFYKADALQNIFQDIEPLFNPDLYYYSATGFSPIIKNLRINELLYPDRLSVFILLVANMVAAGASVFALYEKRRMWLLPLLLILLTYPQAVFIWNADANEIGRHSLFHNIQWRIGVWILIVFVLDFAVEKMKLKFLSGKAA